MVDDATGDSHTMRAVYVSVEVPSFLSWRDVGSEVLTEISFTALDDATTEVVTTQSGLPPQMRTPEARAGWGTALDRGVEYVEALAEGGPA